MVILVILPIAGYGFLWFHRAKEVESQISKSIEDINNKGRDFGIKVSVEDIKITGFPTEFNISLYNFKYSMGFPDSSENSEQVNPISINKMEGVFPGEISLDNEVFGRKSTLYLPNSMDLALENKNGPVKIKTEFESRPIAEINFSRSPIETIKAMISGNLDQLIKPENFRGLFLDGSKGKYTDMLSNEELGSWDKSIMTLNNKPLSSGKNELTFLIQGDNLRTSPKYYELVYGDLGTLTGTEKELYEFIVETGKLAGTTNYNFDVVYTGPLDLASHKTNTDFNLLFNQMSFANDLYGFNSNGKITSVKDDPFPFGSFQIKLLNYKDMIDYLAKFVNLTNKLISSQIEIEAGSHISSPVPFEEINAEDIKKLRELLARIGTVNGNDILFVIKREKSSGPDFSIGNMDSMEVMQLFSQAFFEKAEEEKLIETPLIPPITPVPSPPK